MEKDNLWNMLALEQNPMTAAKGLLDSHHHNQHIYPQESTSQLLQASHQIAQPAAINNFSSFDFEPTPINENAFNRTQSSTSSSSSTSATPTIPVTVSSDGSTLTNTAPVTSSDDHILLRQVLSQANNVIDAADIDFFSSIALPASSVSALRPAVPSNQSLLSGAGSSTPLSSKLGQGIDKALSLSTHGGVGLANQIANNTRKSSLSSSSANAQSGRWYDRYQDLLAFKEEFGHCCVPSHWPRNPPLAQWVKRQRHQYKRSRDGLHSTITPARVDALNQMNFVWDPHSAFWEERLNELYAFRDKYGHCNVPTKFPDNPQLAIWAKCQRRQFKLFFTDGPKRSNMTLDRIAKLSRVGFVFNPRQANKKR